MCALVTCWSDVWVGLVARAPVGAASVGCYIKGILRQLADHAAYKGSASLADTVERLHGVLIDSIMEAVSSGDLSVAVKMC